MCVCVWGGAGWTFALTCPFVWTLYGSHLSLFHHRRGQLRYTYTACLKHSITALVCVAVVVENRTLDWYGSSGNLPTHTLGEHTVIIRI